MARKFEEETRKRVKFAEEADDSSIMQAFEAHHAAGAKKFEEESKKILEEEDESDEEDSCGQTGARPRQKGLGRGRIRCAGRARACREAPTRTSDIGPARCAACGRAISQSNGGYAAPRQGRAASAARQAAPWQRRIQLGRCHRLAGQYVEDAVCGGCSCSSQWRMHFTGS